MTAPRRIPRITAIVLSSALATVVLAGASALTSEPAAAACAPAPAAAVADALGIGALHDRGITGAGVKIGVISTSFDNATTPQLTTAAQDVASGALPGPGNPCGRERPVTVLSDNSPNDDEGRAMLQIVHAIAPSAELYFATADVTESSSVSSDQSTADAIDSMIAAGVDVIVDDIMEVFDTAFSEGLSAAAAPCQRGGNRLCRPCRKPRFRRGKPGRWNSRSQWRAPDRELHNHGISPRPLPRGDRSGCRTDDGRVP